MLRLGGLGIGPFLLKKRGSSKSPKRENDINKSISMGKEKNISQPTNSIAKMCSKYNSQIYKGERFCPECGEPQEV